MEELGELAEAVLSYEGAAGCAYKGKTLNDIKEESIDVFLVIVAILAKIDMSDEEIKSIIRKKMLKWQSVMHKQPN